MASRVVANAIQRVSAASTVQSIQTFTTVAPTNSWVVNSERCASTLKSKRILHKRFSVNASGKVYYHPRHHTGTTKFVNKPMAFAKMLPHDGIIARPNFNKNSKP